LRREKGRGSLQAGLNGPVRRKLEGTDFFDGASESQAERGEISKKVEHGEKRRTFAAVSVKAIG